MEEFCYHSGGQKGFFSMIQNPKTILKILNLTAKNKCLKFLHGSEKLRKTNEKYWTRKRLATLTSEKS